MVRWSAGMPPIRQQRARSIPYQQNRPGQALSDRRGSDPAQRDHPCALPTAGEERQSQNGHSHRRHAQAGVYLFWCPETPNPVSGTAPCRGWRLRVGVVSTRYGAVKHLKTITDWSYRTFTFRYAYVITTWRIGTLQFPIDRGCLERYPSRSRRALPLQQAIFLEAFP